MRVTYCWSCCASAPYGASMDMSTVGADVAVMATSDIRVSTREENPVKRRRSNRPDTGTPHNQVDLVTELIFDSVLDQLVQRIEAGVNDAARETLARVLNHWCVLIRARSEQARNDKRFAAVVLYERFRLRKTVFRVREQQGYLSGVPRYIDVFGKPDTAPSRPTVLQMAVHNSIEAGFEFTPDRVVDDLAKAIGRFERLAAATRGHSSRDLPEASRHAVPEACAALVARMQGHHQRMLSLCRQRPRVGTSISCCEHASCRRRFVHVEQEARVVDGWPQGMDRFMDTIAFLTTSATIHKRRHQRFAHRFCSERCAEQWKAERATLNDAIAGARGEACPSRGMHGSSTFVGTVDRELHGALKRNALTARAIDRWIAKHSGARNRALRSVAIESTVCDWVKPANIEVGLLYASSHLTACTHSASTLAWLPGRDPKWRDDFVTHVACNALGYDALNVKAERRVWKGTEQTLRLVDFVALCYAESDHRNIHPISQKDLLSPPRFLKDIRTRVVKWNMR